MQRETHIDIAKGIAIILMIIGHGKLPALADNFIYSFHMPLFFFCSGYFFRLKPIDQTCSIIKTLVTKHIKPYLITSFAMFILLGLWYKEILPYRSIGFFFPNGNGNTLFLANIPGWGPIWFLLSLLWCRIAYLYIARFKYPFLLSILIFVASFILGHYICNLPLGILPGLCGVVFYSAGSYFRQMQISHLQYICLILCWIGCIFFSRLEMTCFTYKCWPIDICGALGGIVCTLKFSQYIDKSSIWRKCKKVLLWTGTNSLILLCYHSISFYAVEVFKIYIFSFGNKNLAIALNICFMILFILLHKKFKTTLN